MSPNDRVTDGTSRKTDAAMSANRQVRGGSVTTPAGSTKQDADARSGGKVAADKVSAAATAAGKDRSAARLADGLASKGGNTR